MRKLLLAAVCGLVVAGCATIIKGSNQTVSVNTPGVPGAMCTLTSEGIGTKYVQTPGSITLEKSKDNIVVTCTKECYLDSGGVLNSKFQAVTLGNILLGGVIGLGVDAASGAMNEYSPDIQVLMQPDPKCKKPEEPKRKK